MISAVKLIHRLKGVSSGDGLRAQLLRGGAGSLFIKLASTGLSLTMVVVLARLLGADGFGVYSYVLSLVTLLAIPISYGLPVLIVRETAKAQANNEWSLMRGVWRWAILVASVLSLILVVAGGVLAWVFAEYLTSVQLVTFGWGLAFVPMLVLGKLRGAALRGLRRVVLGQLPEQLIRPALLILFVASFAWFSHGTVTADQAMAANVLAAAFVVLIASWLLQRAKPDAVIDSNTREYQPKQWFLTVLPLAFIGGMHVLNTQIDIIMLGTMGSERDVGVYRVASRGAELILFSLIAIRQVVQPYFARFYTQKEFQRLERLATSASRATLALAFPAVIIYLLFGSALIRIVFGAEYADANSPLLILSIAKLMGASFGAIGLLMVMSGYTRDAAAITAVFAGVNIALNAILIPLLGLNGAAIATGSTFVATRLVLWWHVRLRLGIDGSALATRRSSTSLLSP